MIRLKRKFDPDAIAAYRAAIDAGESPTPPAPTHLEVQEQRGDMQRFSKRFVDAGLLEGWVSLGDGELRLRTAKGKPDARFSVLELPGVYCCHCDARLQSGDDVAQAHVAEHHEGPSPDPENPSGYRVSNAYLTEVI